MRLWRSRTPTTSVEADRLDAAAKVLERWATTGSRQSALYFYKREAEARQRQRARADAQTHPLSEAKESCSVETPRAAPPHPPAPSDNPVPSVAPVEEPAGKTKADFEREQFVAFEVLSGNGNRIAERLEEASAYEPEEAPPEYVW